MRILLGAMVLLMATVANAVNPANYGSIDSPLYRAIVGELAREVVSSPVTIPSKSTKSSATTAASGHYHGTYAKIVMETRADCPPCKDWWAQHADALSRDGWDVKDAPAASDKSTPRFRICIGQQCWEHEGWLTVPQLRGYVNQHRGLMQKQAPAVQKADTNFGFNDGQRGWIDSESLSADAQPTPWPGVLAMLTALSPKPNEVLLDPGCGPDARLLIAACRDFGTRRAIGIEIDSALAESARRHVGKAGLSDRIQILTGDSTKMDIQADIGVAYMWPEFLSTFRPRIEELNRFASYDYAVPGLTMTGKTVEGGGKFFVWSKPAVVTSATVATKMVPITRAVRVGGYDMLPRGSWCEVCSSVCRAPMRHRYQQQVVGYQEAEVSK